MTFLHAQGISKRFGKFSALKNMDFSLNAGEVRAVIGSNGAGKTTLIKILTGAHAPTTGKVHLDGRRLNKGPANHIAGGIACIYQHSSLSPQLNVAENLFLGNHPRGKFGLVSYKTMIEKAEKLIAANNTEVSPHTIVAKLPTVKQKEVEILKALVLNAKVILMDEPTAWLSFQEVERLHHTIRKLKSQGVAIVYISHIMDEIFRVCDTASVLRDGALVWSGRVADTNHKQIVGHMLGFEQTIKPRKTERKKTAIPILQTHGLTRDGAFSDINLQLCQGEIVCLTGLIGSGRTEVARCLFGVDQPTSGTIMLRDKPIKLRSPRHAMSEGIALVPEDRQQEGLFLSHNMTENLSSAALPNFVRHILLRQADMTKATEKAVHTLHINPPNLEKTAASLSGGNQQKLLLGKWLEIEPAIIILDEPTVGVDVNAKNDIYQMLQKLKTKGVAILVISSDIEEVQRIADRIFILSSGKLTHEFDASHFSHKDLVAKISGVATL